MRPWVPRAIALTVAYGVGQAAFVALSAWSPSLTTLWSLLLLGVLLGLGVVWAGAEVVLDRRPPEWTWFTAALASAPAAGVLTWLLLLIFVDDTGVEDLGTALIGRAAFTALLVLASVVVGSRLGWFALRRDGRDAEDPALDADDEAVARQASQERVTVASGGPIPRIPRIGSGRGAAGPSIAGVRTSSSAGTVTENERVYTGRRGAVTQSGGAQSGGAQSGGAQSGGAQSGGAQSGGGEPGSVRPTPGGATQTGQGVGAGRSGVLGSSDPRRAPAGPTEAFAPPVVAVLPTSDLPTGSSVGDSSGGRGAETSSEDDHPRRRRFGLRRPGRDAEQDDQ